MICSLEVECRGLLPLIDALARLDDQESKLFVSLYCRVSSFAVRDRSLVTTTRSGKQDLKAGNNKTDRTFSY